MHLLWFLFLLTTLGLCSPQAHAAVGCSLNNPDEDIERFFPEMTSYRVHFVSLSTQNPRGHEELARRLETPLDPVFETENVPYSLYIVEGPESRLGYVLGANNRGAHSSIQVIAALDASGELLEVYLQRIRSPEAERFQSAGFLQALSAHSLEEFSRETACFRDGQCQRALVPDPTEGRAQADYQAILRGLAKLHWLQEILLFPLGGPAPRDRGAQAEWIGNHRGQGLLDAVAHQPELRLTTPDDHPPEAEVFVWGLGRHGLVWPLEALETHSALSTQIGAHTLLLARSHSGGGPRVLRLSAPGSLRPTRDVLWGDRVFLDDATLSRWSLALGEAVYGQSSGEPLQTLHGGLRLSWSEAQSSGLLLLNAGPDFLPQERTTLEAGDYLLVKEAVSSRAWRLGELEEDALYTDDTLVIARVGDAAAVWSRTDHEGRRHHLHRESTLHLRDRATGSTWSLISGKALSGPLQGAQLLAPTSQTLSEEGLFGLFPDSERMFQ